MKALLIAVGSAGDVHPFVGLGIAMAQRGHEVTLVASGYFEGLARQAGLDFEAFASADDYRPMIEDARLWNRWQGFQAAARLGIVPMIGTIYEIVCRHYEPGRTVVAASTLGLGARLAQEKLALPLASVHLSPAVFRSDFRNPVLPAMFLPEWLPVPLKRLQYWFADTAVIDRVVGKPLNAYRSRLGLPPVRRPFAAWLHSPQRVLGLFPDWFFPPQPDWPPGTILTGFPLYDERGVTPPSEEVKRFVEAGDPPLVFTPGSAMLHGRGFFTAAAEACRILGRRGMLLTRFAEQVPEGLPGGVRHFDFVPFSWLLPRAAALVHHGGIGTSSQGLAAGIPQLVMPMSFDQPDNAARLSELGVGSYLRPYRFSGPAVANELQRLLGSAAVAGRCKEFAARIAAGDPMRAACEALEGLG